MSPDTPTDPKQLLSQLVQKQIAIFGSQVTVQELKTIKGLVVDVQGNVTQFSDTPQAVASSMLASWQALSPYLAQKIAQPMLTMLLNGQTPTEIPMQQTVQPLNTAPATPVP